jgi:hypothetical protein
VVVELIIKKGKRKGREGKGKRRGKEGERKRKGRERNRKRKREMFQRNAESR